MMFSRKKEDFYVKFKDQDGRLFELEDMYFCDGCSRVYSRLDLTEEIDSYYCPHCLENMPSSEAMLFMNRCSKCFECPMCFNTLTMMVSPDNLYCFSCQFCRWNSKLVGWEANRPEALLQDLALKREKDCIQRIEMRKIVEVYRKSSHEKAREKELQARIQMRRKSLGLLFTVEPVKHVAGPWDLDNLAAAMVQAETSCTYPDVRKSIKKGITLRHASLSDLLNFQGTEAQSLHDNQDLLVVPLKEVTSAQQRRRCPTQEPLLAAQLFPTRKPLLTKRSRRCPKKGCGRYVTRPQINPCSSPPFQKLNIAIWYLPRIQLLQPVQPTSGGDYQFEFFVVNPLDQPTQVEFVGENDHTDPAPTIHVVTEKVKTELAPFNDLLDVHEVYGEEEPQYQVDDDPEVIVQRKWNRIAVRLKARVKDDTQGLEATAVIRCDLNITDKAEKSHSVSCYIVFNFGRIGEQVAEAEQKNNCDST